jgi:hypothetical protein
VGSLVRIPWVRDVTVTQWLNDDRSKSYIVNLPEPARIALLTTIAQILRGAFPRERMEVPYETLLWIASKE